MTVTHHDTRAEEATELQSSPGHRLREARLSAKISVEEVAARLHLDARLIDALENDRYGELPQPTFVRGYLRGYAHLLNLPSTPIIEAYDRHGFGALPVLNKEEDVVGILSALDLLKALDLLLENEKKAKKNKAA